jgi:hypothetical protein
VAKKAFVSELGKECNIPDRHSSFVNIMHRLSTTTVCWPVSTERWITKVGPFTTRSVLLGGLNAANAWRSTSVCLTLFNIYGLLIRSRGGARYLYQTVRCSYQNFG